MVDVRNYALVTGAYWGFTLTDGALHMLVLLHFYHLGYTPLQIALLFLLYEFFGLVTNLVGGWVGSKTGLKITLFGGLALQIVALVLLSRLDNTWSVGLSVAYVTACQSLSGIAKDLTKMSSKSAIKLVVPHEAQGTLFKWVALLTGSKNALKGVGFFLGGFLLAALGFANGLLAMAAALAVVLVGCAAYLRQDLGKSKAKVKLGAIFSRNPAINVLSAARLFLFGSRDVWFVVGLPVFLSATLGMGFAEVGGFLAAWVIGYGIVQSLVPSLLRYQAADRAPTGRTALLWVAILAVVPAGIALALGAGTAPIVTIAAGLTLFGVIFAINSAVHSYLIVSYSDVDRVSLNVGFYYSANAAGRLVGTLLSGLMFQVAGLNGCLWVSAAFVLLATGFSLFLPVARAVPAAPVSA